MDEKHGPGWIASARVEEAAGKFLRLAKVCSDTEENAWSGEGCQVCGDTEENVWSGEGCQVCGDTEEMFGWKRVVKYVVIRKKCWVEQHQHIPTTKLTTRWVWG